MRRSLVVLIVLAQLGVLGWMVLGKEFVVLTGQRVFLQTAPIDPRDPFRGDFVRLRYPMNNLATVDLRLDRADADPGNKQAKTDVLLRRDQPVYASLQRLGVTNDKIREEPWTYGVSYVTDTRPGGGLYIKGRASRTIKSQTANMPARFGIEQLFVEQGAGIEMEEKLGVRGGWQIPLEVELAIKKGTAVIVGHRFAKLGMQLQPLTRTESTASEDAEDTVEEASADRGAQVVGVRVLLKNVSEKAITILDPLHRCAWSLKPVTISNQPDREVVSCDAAAQDQPGMLELKADESRSIDVLFADEEWFVTANAEASLDENRDGQVPAGDIREVAAGERFRLRYKSELPDVNLVEAYPNFWNGVVASPAFNGRGQVD